MADGRIVIDTKLDSSGLEQGIKSLGTVVKAGIAGLGLASLKAVVGDIATETKALSDSIRKASTLFGNVAVDTDKLRSKMSELAISTGMSSEAIGDALYNALSAGVEVTEDMGVALEFIESSAKTAKGGFADLGETVTATASVLNAYGMATTEATRVQNILMQTQNLGITTVGELASTLSQVIPTASAFNVSFEQIGASLATMTAQGTKTAQATTSLNALLSELGKQGQVASKNLAKASESAGISATSFQDLINEGYTLADILNLMQDYAEANGLSLVDMFGSIEAGRGALQLATADGENFNKALAKMNETGNLVEGSFNRVLSNADRLSNAFSELKKLIGGEFAPIVDSASGGLADLIERIVANGNEASLLSRAFDDLRNATEGWTKAQEDSLNVSEELGEAMKAEAVVNLTNTLLANTAIFNEAQKSIEDLKKANKELEADVTTAYEGMTKEAQKFGYTLEDVSRLYASGQLLADGAMNDLVLAWEDGSKIIIDATAEIASNEMLIAESEKLVEEFMRDIISLAREGAVDLEYFKVANVELYDAVTSYTEGFARASAQIEKQKNSVETLTSSVAVYTSLMESAKTPEAWAKWSAYVDVYTEALNEALALQKKLDAKPVDDYDSSPVADPASLAESAEALAQIEKNLADVEKYKTTLGDSFAYSSEKSKVLQNGIKTLISLGLDPASDEVQNLVKQFHSLNEGLDSNSKLEAYNNVFRKLNTTINDAGKLHEVLGDEYDASSVKISAYQTAIEELIELGLDPASEEVQRLITLMNNLEAPKIDRNTIDVFKSFFSKDTMQSNITNSLQSAFSSMIDSISTADKRLDDLKANLEEVNGDIADAEAEKLELANELADAQARGDEEAIERAEEELELLDEQIAKFKKLKESIEDESKAIESGEDAWKSFGKAGLLALAEVLEALGHELTAMAVTSLLKLDFVGSALATAGAIGAYASATAIKSSANSFADGGIVQKQAGVSAIGDNHIAFVNAGELILNQAQQENLADQIRAMSSAIGGSGIYISMSGAYIYGLDEPAVGRAIYDNIEALRAEGVL